MINYILLMQMPVESESKLTTTTKKNITTFNHIHYCINAPAFVFYRNAVNTKHKILSVNSQKFVSKGKSLLLNANNLIMPVVSLWQMTLICPLHTLLLSFSSLFKWSSLKKNKVFFWEKLHLNDFIPPPQKNPLKKHDCFIQKTHTHTLFVLCW